MPFGSARCGHPAGAAAGCSAGNACPGGRPGGANATTVMAMTAMARRRSRPARTCRAARCGRSLLAPHPAGPAGTAGSGTAAADGGRRAAVDVAVAIAGAAVVVGVLVAAVALRDRIGGGGGWGGRRRGRRGGRGGRRRGGRDGARAGVRRRAAGACGGAEWAWLCAAPAGFGAAGCAGGPPDEPHAASVTATAAAGSASSIRGWRLSSFSRVRDLVTVSPCGAAGSRPSASRATVGGGADEPGMTATMPRQRLVPSRPAPNLMPGWQESRPSCHQQQAGAGRWSAVCRPPARSAQTRRPRSPRVRLLPRRLSLPGAAGPPWGLLRPARRYGGHRRLQLPPSTERRHREAQILQTGAFYSAARFRIIEDPPSPPNGSRCSRPTTPDPSTPTPEPSATRRPHRRFQPQLSQSFRLASARKTNRA